MKVVKAADLRANVLGSVGVRQRVARFLEVEACRTDVCYHDGLTVAAERVLEQPRQLAVPVVYILGARLVACSTFKLSVSDTIGGIDNSATLNSLQSRKWGGTPGPPLSGLKVPYEKVKNQLLIT